MPVPDRPTPDQTARVAHEWAFARVPVSAYVRGLVADRSEREDILQQTVLYLVEHAAEYTGEGFLTCALRVAHFRVMDHWKHKKRGRSFLQMAETLATAAAETAPPDEDAQEERIEALRACIGHLPAEHRRLVERRYGDALDLAALAEETGRAPGALATALHRIRNSLADCIKKKLGRRDD